MTTNAVEARIAAAAAADSWRESVTIAIAGTTSNDRRGGGNVAAAAAAASDVARIDWLDADVAALLPVLLCHRRRQRRRSQMGWCSSFLCLFSLRAEIC